MLIPAGTLSIGSSLPPTGDIRTSRTGAEAADGRAATAGGCAGAAARGRSALAAAGGRARLALGAMASIFGKVGAGGAGAGVSDGGAAFGAAAGGAAGFFFGATTSSCGRGGAVGAGVSGARAGGSAAGGRSLGDGTWLKATSKRTTQPTITVMPHRKIHIRPPAVSFSKSYATLVFCWHCRPSNAAWPRGVKVAPGREAASRAICQPPAARQHQPWRFHDACAGAAKVLAARCSAPGSKSARDDSRPEARWRPRRHDPVRSFCMARPGPSVVIDEAVSPALARPPQVGCHASAGKAL